MKENGKMEKEMDLEFYVGETNPNLWDYLKKIKFWDMANYGMKMEIYIKDIGKISKLKE